MLGAGAQQQVIVAAAEVHRVGHDHLGRVLQVTVVVRVVGRDLGAIRGQGRPEEHREVALRQGHDPLIGRLPPGRREEEAAVGRIEHYPVREQIVVPLREDVL